MLNFFFLLLFDFSLLPLDVNPVSLHVVGCQLVIARNNAKMFVEQDMSVANKPEKICKCPQKLYLIDRQELKICSNSGESEKQTSPQSQKYRLNYLCPQ